jgi:hypothetical protein
MNLRSFHYRIPLAVISVLLLAVFIHIRFKSPLRSSLRRVPRPRSLRKDTMEENCVNLGINGFNQIDTLIDLPAHSEILINKQMDNEKQVTVDNVSFDIAHDAVLLKIPNGTVFLGWSGVIDDQKNLYRFRHWENLPTKESGEITNCSEIAFYNHTIMSFLMIWGQFNSHLLATVLPKLSFTCDYLMRYPDIKILMHKAADLVPTPTLMQKICPQLKSERFITLGIDLVGIKAANLLWPFFFSPEAPFWQLGMYPKNSMSPLGVAKPERTILYMPRSMDTSRYLTNEVSVLTGICDVLSYNSSLQLSIFDHSACKNQKDEECIYASSPRVILSVHNGAMANILYAPPDAQLMEIGNPPLGNPFYLGFARVLGLNYTLIKPQTFSHNNVTIPTRVEVEDVVKAIQTVPEVFNNPPSHRDKLDRLHKSQCYKIVSNKFIKR